MEENNQSESKEKIGTWKAFVGVLTSPGATFDKLLETPRTWLPNLYLGLAVLVVTLPFYGKYHEYMKLILTQLAPSQGAMPGNVLDMMITTQTITTIVVLALAPLISTLILAALLKLLNFVMGEETKFKQLWTVTTFAYFPIVLGLLLKNLLLLTASGDNLLYTFFAGISLAALVPKTAGVTLISLLAAFNITTVWCLVLTILGTAKAFRSSALRVGTVVFAVYLLYSLGAALLFGPGKLEKLLG